MNSLMQQMGDVLIQTQTLRQQLNGVIDSSDLSYSPGGDSPTLGNLYRQLGETTQQYIEGFKTFKHSYEPVSTDAALETDLNALDTWLTELEQSLNSILSDFSEEILQTQLIDRGYGLQFPIVVNVQVYREALLIFCAKVSIYLRALGKELPEQWKLWIS
ncbi:MAG: hypothetical protein AAF708_01345 [Deinococcota bacterium]